MKAGDATLEPPSRTPAGRFSAILEFPGWLSVRWPSKKHSGAPASALH